AHIDAGKVGGFTVNQSFLVGTTAYVVVPSLMVFFTLILRPQRNRITNITLAVIYAVTIVAAAIGEWNYVILGSAIEGAQLAAIGYYAWTWPKEAPETPLRGARLSRSDEVLRSPRR